MQYGRYSKSLAVVSTRASSCGGLVGDHKVQQPRPGEPPLQQMAQVTSSCCEVLPFQGMATCHPRF